MSQLRRATADLAGNAVERDAKIRLKREHDKLVARLGVGGGLAVIFLTILVLVVADKMGRLPGGLLVGGVALVSVALFFASFVSADFAESVNRALSSKTEDPLTGKPLRMLWWFRWFAAMLGLFLFVGLSDYTSPPAQSPESSAETEADSAPIAPPTQQQILDARLALCVAVADELETVRLGKPHKDAIVLANQFSVGEKAGGRAIGHEWFAYKDGEWHDSACHDLSTASWALGEGYAGDPVDLPDGAIAEVVNSGGWTPPSQ